MENRFELFTVLIAKISRGIKRIKTAEMEKFGLKSVHVNCLYYLYKSNGISAVKLCEMSDVDKAGISRSLEFLEKKGLIECESNAKKRYNSVLKLTEKGSEVAKKTVEKIDKYLSDISKGLSENDREILYKSLKLISKNIEELI